MIPILCAGWILGISFIGIDLPVISQLPQMSSWFFVCVLAFFIFFYYRIQQVLFRFLGGIIAVLMVFCLGYGYANYQLEERLKYRVTETSQQEVIVFVDTLNSLRDDRIQQTIQVLNQFSRSVIWQSTLKRDQHTPLEIGKYYRLTGKVIPVHSYAIEGAFDIEKWYIEKNWMANYQIQTVNEVTAMEVEALGYSAHVKQHQKFYAQFKRWIEKQRLDIRQFIMQQPIAYKGLTLALLTGDESLLNKQTEEQFQRFGMSHLLAISGPHVLIFATMFCWLLNFIICKNNPNVYRKFPKPYFMVFPFLCCVFLYCAYVGFEIPALRTLLVCILASLWILVKYPIRPLTLLSMSAAILLIFDPFSVLSAAFWLSYGACFILLRIYQTLQNHNFENMTIAQKSVVGLKLLVESQWKIFIALFPLMVIFFKHVAWITPFSNLFAIPIIGLIIVPLDVLAGLSYFVFSPLSSVLFQLNQFCISFLLLLIEVIDHIFAPQLIPIALNGATLLCVVMALIIFFLPRGVIPKVWAIVCLLPIIFIENNGTFKLHILDVGQGQSIHLQVADQNLLIDTGGYYDEEKFSVGKQIVQPYLLVNGISEIDALFLTHLDQDHSGAFDYLNKHIKFNQVISNEQMQLETAIQFEYCYQGQVFQLNQQVKIEVLSPMKDALPYAKFDKNEHSCVLYVQVKDAYPYQNFLLMGDAGWETEFKLLNEYPNLNVDVLVLGHHGSQHSSSYDFLNTYKPKIAIASAGKNNRYGHPSQMVQARLAALNIPMLSTIDEGAIYFRQNKIGKMEVQTARETKKWWYRRDFPNP